MVSSAGVRFMTVNLMGETTGPVGCKTYAASGMPAETPVLTGSGAKVRGADGRGTRPLIAAKNRVSIQPDHRMAAGRENQRDLQLKRSNLFTRGATQRIYRDFKPVASRVKLPHAFPAPPKL